MAGVQDEDEPGRRIVAVVHVAMLAAVPLYLAILWLFRGADPGRLVERLRRDARRTGLAAGPGPPRGRPAVARILHFLIKLGSLGRMRAKARFFIR